MREMHLEFSNLTDEEFLSRLPEIIHFAVFAAWIKEIPTEVCLSDKGIIHELVHLLHLPGEPVLSLKEIRTMFEDQLYFA